MKQQKVLVKFTVFFLIFYIFLRVMTMCTEYISVHNLVNFILYKHLPVSDYLDKEEIKYGDYVIGTIMYNNPIILYAAQSEPAKKDMDGIEKSAESFTEKTTEKKTTQKTTKKDTKKTTQKTSKQVSNIFDKPKITGVKYSIDKLSDYDFLINNFYTVSASTVVYKSDLNPKKLMKKDLSIKNNNKSPQILIYHTHSQERFADSGEDKNKSIVGVGTYLAEILREQYGYNVIHLTDEFDMMKGTLDRHKAYDFSRDKVSQVLRDNPSIELIIDLHRDGVDESLHFVTEINGKPTAKIMFFNGLSRLASIGEIDYLKNPYREDNLALSMQMKMNAEAYFPGFTRKNYLHAYEYNLSLMPKAMLIEAGAQTNTYEEELNAMEPLAVLLNLTVGNKK